MLQPFEVEVDGGEVGAARGGSALPSTHGCSPAASKAALMTSWNPDGTV
jgi:hypothetical protein